MVSKSNLDDLKFSDMRLLSVLLQTESLTSASLTLGWSIPKASHRLTKVRESLDDELFVRSGNSLVPTSRMKELAPKIAAAVEAMESLSVEERYRVDEIERMITFEMVDNAAAVLLAPVFKTIHEKAPLLKILIRPSIGRTLENLWDGTTELAFGLDIDRDMPNYVAKQELFRSRHVFVVRKSHPLLEKIARRIEAGGESCATAEDLSIYPYLSISLPRWRSLASRIDVAWKTEVPSPVLVESPYFLALAEYLVASDAYALLPAELAERFSKFMPLTFVEGRADEVRPWNPHILWHKRSSPDFALQWLRSEICRHFHGHKAVPTSELGRWKPPHEA